MNRIRRWASWATTVLLSTAFVASLTGYLAIRIITDDVLDPAFYTRAMHDNNIYDRVYSDLLADPAMRRVVEQLLGNYKLTPEQSRHAYGQVISALRLVLPPEIIQTAAERAASELAAYLEGDRERLRGNISLTRAVYDPNLRDKVIASTQSVETVLIAQIREKGVLLSNGENPKEDSLLVLYAQLEQYLTALARGAPAEPPPVIKTFPIERLTTAEKRQLARVLLLPAGDQVSQDTRRQVDAALAVNDLPGALVIVSGSLANLRVDDAIRALQTNLDSGTLSGLEELAGLADHTAQDLMKEINRVRDVIAIFHRWAEPLVIGMTLLSATGLIIQQGKRSKMRLLRTLGIVFTLSGGGLILASILLETLLDNPFATYRIAGISSNDLPHSLAAMINDVLGSLRRDLRLSIWARSSLPLVVGLMLLSISMIPSLQERVLPWIARLEGRYQVAVGASVALVIGLLVVGDRLIESPSGAPPPLKCNGHASLCRKPFDQVVFAASHNAMAVANEGWIWPSQDGSLTLQLEAGVRALLIDTHYGDSQAKIETYIDRMPVDMRPLMRQVLATADPALQDPGQTFLCHNLCSLGGIPLVNALAEIRDFLDRHPREVVVLLIQDGISVTDTVSAFEASGLVHYAYARRPGDRWPTLEEMIETDQRLVVMAEQQGPPPNWYHHMWDYVEETSYAVTDPAQFNCAANRGGTDHALFLLNHWISTRAPDRVDAARINSRSFLLSRANLCAEARDQMPNFIAVDFYSVGDLFQVVDELNGVRRSS